MMPTVPSKSERIYCLGGPPTGIWAIERRSKETRYLGEGDSPTISPDGKRIAFLSEPYNQTIGLCNPQGGERRMIHHATAYKGYIAFMPDSKSLLFLAEDSIRGSGTLKLLHLQDGRIEDILPIKF